MMRDPKVGTVLVLTDRGEKGRTAGIEGLVTCGSVWSCPVCAAKIAAKRAEELAHVLEAVHAAGGSAFMLTLTIKHSAGDRLGLSADERYRRGVLDRRRKWRNRLAKIADRRDHRETAEAKGWDVDEHQAETDDIVEGSIREDIAEHDPDMIVVGRAARKQRENDDRELADLTARQGCWDAVTGAWHAATSGRAWTEAQDAAGLLGWVRVVEVTDGGSPAVVRALGPEADGLSGNGCHVQVHALLCFKNDVSEEYAAAAIGAGTHARWAAKARKLETYTVEHMARWWEWEAATEGRRQLTWSTGTRNVRALAELGTEQTDATVADETLSGEQRIELGEEASRWLSISGHYPALLDAAEAGGLEGVTRWLARHLLAWRNLPMPVARSPRRYDR